MLLKRFRVKPGTATAYTNVYLISDENTRIGAVIDPAGDIDKIYNYIENNNITLKYAILTHCHGDHIGGLLQLKRYYPKIRIVAHEIEKEAMLDDTITLCTFLNLPENTVEADYIVKDNDIINMGDIDIKVIHTPGHTAGSISLVVGDALFSGDTLFRHIYGRTDLKTSSSEDMLVSIRDKLLKLPGDTIIYPGHGAISIIREEREFYSK